ncbi:MAG: hypothetical protein HQK51_19830 [Oligoflexia bacterium]|nr:hypothetical protein [Oligoflexia bacterium]
MIVEIVHHLLKWLEDKDISKIENFTSILFPRADFAQNIIILCIYLIIIIIITDYNPLVVKQDGIIIMRNSMVNGIFYSNRIFISWDEIHMVSHKYKFFEPYLIFYGKKDNEYFELGHIDFGLKDQYVFIEHLRSILPIDHPLQKALSSNIS